MFPLWYLLAPYVLIVAIAGLFVFFNVYHVAKFGLQSGLSLLVIAGYTLSFLAVVTISFGLLSTFDWSSTIDLTSLFRFSVTGSSLNSL